MTTQAASTPAHRTIRLESPEATARLGQRIAPHLRPGDVLLLEGPIGAGKSHFARAVIQARLAATGRMEDVPSPTYTLVQTYEDDAAEIWHADLYRLTHPDEVLELGLTEAFATAICLVEWPDRLGNLTPEGALTFDFSLADAEDARLLTFTGPAARFADLVNADA